MGETVSNRFAEMQESDEYTSDEDSTHFYMQPVGATIRHYAKRPGTEEELSQKIDVSYLFSFMEKIFPGGRCADDDLKPAKLQYYWNVLSYKSSDEPDWLDTYVRLCVLLGKLPELEEVYESRPEGDFFAVFSIILYNLKHLSGYNQSCVDFIIQKSIKMHRSSVLHMLLGSGCLRKKHFEFFEEVGISAEEITTFYFQTYLKNINKVLIDMIVENDVDVNKCLRNLKTADDHNVFMISIHCMIEGFEPHSLSQSY